MYLEDPAKLVDAARVRAAEEAVAKAKDPLDRLKALADLTHVRQADEEQITRDFVERAKGYAERESIPVGAFQEMGVPSEMLAQAGFDVRGRRSSGPSGRSRGAGGSRAPRVPLEQVKAAVLQMPKRFTLADVAKKAGGGSPVTVRKAVDELVADKKVDKLGPLQNYKGRGRAPTEYQLR
jgi:hypothetical protein